MIKTIFTVTFCLSGFLCFGQKAETALRNIQNLINHYHNYEVIEYDEITNDNYGTSFSLHTYYEKSVTDTLIGLRYYAENDFMKITYNGNQIFSLGKQNTSFYYLGKNQYELLPVEKPFIPSVGFAGSYPAYVQAFESILSDTAVNLKIQMLTDTVIDGFDCMRLLLESNEGRILGNVFRQIPGNVLFRDIFYIDKNDYLIRRKDFSNSFGYQSTTYYKNYIFNKNNNNVMWYLSDYPDAIKYERVQYTLLEKGNEVPDFKAILLENGEIDKTFIKGKTTLFYFWNLNCDASKLAEPVLKNLVVKYPGLQILAVNNEDEDINKIKKRVESERLNYPVVIGNKELATSFGCNAWPSFILFDKNGVVIYSQSGLDESILEENIKKAL